VERRRCAGGDGEQQCRRAAALDVDGGGARAAELRGRKRGRVVLRRSRATAAAACGRVAACRRRSCVRAAAERRRGAQRLARKKEDVGLTSRAHKETGEKVSAGPQTLKHRKDRWFIEWSIGESTGVMLTRSERV